jgi:hypothetical protein
MKCSTRCARDSLRNPISRTRKRIQTNLDFPSRGIRFAVLSRVIFFIKGIAREYGDVVVFRLGPTPPFWLPVPRNLHLKRHVRRLDEVIRDIMHQRRADRQDRGDLAMLVYARDEANNTGMTDKHLRDGDELEGTGWTAMIEETIGADGAVNHRTDGRLSTRRI